VHPIYAVRYRMAKIALPCSPANTHGKERKHGKIDETRTAMKHTWQRPQKTHGKDSTHGNKGRQPTAKKSSTAKVPSLAVHTIYALRASTAHGKGSLCRAS
jgi:hypothetical protein